MKNSSKKFRYLLRKILCWKNSRDITGWSKGNPQWDEMPYRLDKKQQTGIQVPHRFHASASESRSPPSDGVSHLKIFAEVPISEKGIVFFILVSRPRMIHFRFETCCHLKVVSNFEMWSELHQCRCRKLVELTRKLIWNDVWGFPLFLWLSFAVKKDTLMLHPL